MIDTSCIPNSEIDPLAKPLTGNEPTPSEIQEEIRKYIRLIPDAPEPNLARVQEIKEQIREGTYLTREMIEETANRLALRFLHRE